MKLLWVVCDAARAEGYKEALATSGAPGWTLSPVLEGSGRTGLHAGDRVHPGGLLQLSCVASDDEAGRLFDVIQRAREAAGDTVTRLFLLPVERQA